jgi:hypothetical protein
VGWQPDASWPAPPPGWPIFVDIPAPEHLGGISLPGTYLGGLPATPARCDGTYTIDETGCSFHTLPRRELYWQIPWPEVAALRLEDGGSRASLNMIALFGVLGLAAKRKSTLILTATASGQAAVWVDGMQVMNATAGAAGWLAWFASWSAPPAAAAPNQTISPAADVADQIARLADLRQQGLLSDEEFGAAKAKVFGL